jgi:streptogramin lyase
LLTFVVAHAPSPVANASLSTLGGGAILTWSDSYKVVQYPLPNASSNPWVVTVDTSGNVWFVEQGTNQLGELDPTTGAIHQFSIPTPGSTPDSVASDSRGNVWFGELTAGNLAELRRGERQVAEHKLPGVEVNVAGSTQKVDCGPGPVLPDASGSVWVACLFSNQILRFFPSNGSFARFDLPVFESAPAGITMDGHGNLWFTAADANMLGKAVVSQLKNNTSDGITEFAPLNETYTFRVSHPTSFFGSSENITSSLPTPSGIALDPSGRLWITEHVDSSFDSYDPSTGSLVRYWTSQTNDAYGFKVSFPNGLAVDPNGTVWVGEHYGNKVAQLSPATGQLTEFAVPCCASTIAGVYSVALDSRGDLWFVEIQGNAIGEILRTSGSAGLSISLPGTYASLGADGSMTLPLSIGEAGDANGDNTLSLSLSGVSATGALENMTATFDPEQVNVTPGSHALSNLTLSLAGIRPGVYYLTLTATASGGVQYSAILRLTVTGGPTSFPLILVPATLAMAVVAAYVAWRLARRPLRRDSRRRPSKRATSAMPTMR